MKISRMLGVVILLAASMSLLACTPKGPIGQLDGPVYDFGSMDQNDAVSHTFLLKNVGDQNLEITRTRSTCGCTVAKPSKDLLGVGEVSEIVVTFNSGRRQGQQTKKVTVYTNDPNQEKFVLTLSGEVTVRLAFEPTRLRIKNAVAGEPTEHFVTATNAGNGPLTITKIEFNEKAGSGLTLAAGENALSLPLTLAADESTKVAFQLDLTEDQPFFHANAVFHFEDNKAPAQFYVSASQKGAMHKVRRPAGIGKKDAVDKKDKMPPPPMMGVKKGVTSTLVKVKKDEGDE
jgi:Protein of unknown function (DUF1573)